MKQRPGVADTVLYYAPGGGLGHIRRARKVAAARGFTGHWTLATASAHAGAPWLDAGTPIEVIPSSLTGNPDALRTWLIACIDRIQPAVLYVDAFPGGLFGECCGLPALDGIELVHVARLLDWQRYRERLAWPLPHYAKVLVLEALHEDHRAALASLTPCLIPLDLRAATGAMPQMRVDADPLWLIVHSEPLDEVLDLVVYAREAARAEQCTPRFVVISACTATVPGVEWLVGVDALDWYPRASRLFTAAGFNTLLETEPWRERRHITPMPRALDDQFERARRARQV